MVLCIATLAHFKKSRQQWTAFLSDRTTKVLLPLSDLKIIEGESMRDIGPSESRPKLERQKTVMLELAEEHPEPKINAWALVPA